MSTIRNTLEALVIEALHPSYFELVNESSSHNVPKDSETHFKLTCISEEFDGLNAVKRHQKVYALAKDCFAEGLHALALHLYTDQEWSKKQGSPESPACMGGSKG
ncbi:MAG: BolA protein [Flavobacteriales bacterium]|jgi:BolA protein